MMRVDNNLYPINSACEVQRFDAVQSCRKFHAAVQGAPLAHYFRSN